MDCQEEMNSFGLGGFSFFSTDEMLQMIGFGLSKQIGLVVASRYLGSLAVLGSTLDDEAGVPVVVGRGWVGCLKTSNQRSEKRKC